MYIYTHTYIYVFIFFVADRLFSSFGERGATLWLRCTGFSLWWLLLFWAWALGVWASVVTVGGLSCCSSQAVEHRFSSWGMPTPLLHGTQELPPLRIQRTSVSCISRRILDHWVTREGLLYFFLFKFIPLLKHPKLLFTEVASSQWIFKNITL